MNPDDEIMGIADCMASSHRLAEQHTIQHTLIEVAKAVNVPLTIKAEPAGFFDVIQGNGKYTIAVTWSTPTVPHALIYACGITQYFDDESLRGAIAHELGHISIGHVCGEGESEDCTRKSEQNADIFAAEHGFGNGLIKALYATENDRPQEYKDAEGDHGTVAQREATIKAHMPQSKGASV